MTVHVISPLENRYEYLFKIAENREYPNNWGRSKETLNICISTSELRHYWFPVMERLKVAGIDPDGSNANISMVKFEEIVIGFVT